MNCPRALRPVIRAVLSLTAVAAAATCGSPPTVVPPPNPGTVSLTVTTTGSDLDQNGYTVALDGGAPQNVSPNGTLTFSGIDPGSHSLTLGDVASNCSVGGSNPLSFTVQSDATSSVRFDVQCGVVIAASGGTATTPDGKARVDVPSGALADTTIISVVPAPDSMLPSPAPGYVTGSAYEYRPNGTQFAKPVQITIVYDPANVPSGASESSIRLHTVQNGQWVPVTGSTVDTSLHTVTGQTTHFSVYGAVAAQPGVLKAISATSGANLDPDGYSLVVDGGAGQHMAINDTLDVAGLSVGSHTVELDSVASNCTVAGANPQTVSVPAQDTVAATFTVSCSSLTGDLKVTTSTSGSNLDPDGYAVSVDSGPTQHVAINDSLTLPGLAAGSHSVQLDSVAANCTVAGGATQTVTVPNGGTVTAAFSVNCSASIGYLKVRAPTTGTDLDPDGYLATVDGGLNQSVATGDSVTFTVATGKHSVQLSGIAANCSVSGSNPVSVGVAFDSTSTATFDVSCVADVGSVMATTSSSGTSIPSTYTVDLDGSNPRSIGANSSTGVTFSNVLTGIHTVNLTVPNNCTVTSAGGASKSVTVSYNNTVTAAFTVSCQASVGSIHTTTSSSGSSIPGTYTVDWDGTHATSIDSTSSTGVTFSNVPTGIHTVNLTVPNNCTVTSAGGASKSVTVSYNSTVTVAFTVSCQASVGSIDVTTLTSGTDFPSTYTVDWDGTHATSIKSTTTNGTKVTFTNVPTGIHTVNLTVPKNCTVTSAGGASKSVTVSYNSTTTAAFTIFCQANVGSIQASNTTTGTDLDPDGYSVSVDGGTAQTMITNGDTTFSNVAVGTHSVAINSASVAPNCTVTSANPTSANVTYGNTATASFAISCVSNVGSIQASAASSGTSVPTSYTVQLDSDPAQTIGANSTYLFTSVSVGNHQVTLNVPSPTCTVTSTNPLPVSVTFGNQASAPFTVSCP